MADRFSSKFGSLFRKPGNLPARQASKPYNRFVATTNQQTADNSIAMPFPHENFMESKRIGPRGNLRESPISICRSLSIRLRSSDPLKSDFPAAEVHLRDPRATRMDRNHSAH